MEEKQIIYIDAEHIIPHPENPRKDLGDLSELVESIKKNGILQNLTVIPIEGKPGEYMTLIGHRRYAAGTQAGVEKFPCKIAENLTQREQVAIMLEENMQRNDLTIWEQASGFQMMLDLGETEDSIAEKTGFSKTTVKHRLNIAKLDKKVLQEKEKDESFQLSLKNLYELEKIPDIKERDKILKNARDSNNLVQMSRSKVMEIKRKENKKAYIKLCEAEGIKPAPKEAENEKYSGKWEIIKDFELDGEVKDKTGCKSRAKKEELFYVVFWERTFAIIAKKKNEKKKLTPEEVARKEREKKNKEIKSMKKVMAAERVEFIKTCISENFKPENGKPEDMLPQLFYILVRTGTFLGESKMKKFITGESYFSSDTPAEEIAEYERQRDSLSLLHKMMIYAADGVADKELTDYYGKYNKESGDIVMCFDEILTVFGFSYSNEDFYKIAEGSHDSYFKEEKEEKADE